MSNAPSAHTELISLKSLAKLKDYRYQDTYIANTHSFNHSARFDKFYLHESPIITQLPSVTVTVGLGIGFTSDGYVLSDFSLRLPTARFSKQFPTRQALGRLPTDRSVSPQVLFLGGHKNYYHWMLNWLSRVSILEAAGAIDSYDSILIGENPAPYQLNTLNSIPSISSKRVILASPQSAVEFKACQWTSIYQDPLHAPSHIAWLRRVFLTEKEETLPKKLYISREDAQGRRGLANEEEALAVLHRNGFKKIVLSGLTIKQQASLFSNATAIVAPHGAALANLVFCSKGVKVCELQSKLTYTSMYHSLGSIIGAGRYDIISCEATANRQLKLQDLHVDINKLKTLIQTY
jgi:capsular polysaccharide biosynthesis protein